MPASVISANEANVMGLIPRRGLGRSCRRDLEISANLTKPSTADDHRPCSTVHRFFSGICVGMGLKRGANQVEKQRGEFRVLGHRPLKSSSLGRHRRRIRIWRSLA
jgi:hypothetical protein